MDQGFTVWEKKKISAPSEKTGNFQNFGKSKSKSNIFIFLKNKK